MSADHLNFKIQLLQYAVDIKHICNMHHLYDGTAKRIIFFMRMRSFEPGAYAHIPIKCHFKGLLTPWKDCNLINNVKVFAGITGQHSPHFDQAH